MDNKELLKNYSHIKEGEEEEVLTFLKECLTPLAEAAEDTTKRMAIYRLFNKIERVYSEIDRLNEFISIEEESNERLNTYVKNMLMSRLFRHSDGKIYFLVPSDDVGQMTDNEIAVHNNCISDRSAFAQI